MKFAHLEHLYWLLVVPALALIAGYGIAMRKSEMKRFASAPVLPRVVAGLSRTKRTIKLALFFTATFLLVVSLVGPRWGFHWEDVRRRGIDIVIAVDTSESMLSRDVEPSRLERSKREVYDLIKMLHGDRVGLVVFAGGAFLQCPLTLDYGACLMFLDYIDTTLVPQKGTNLGEAIRKAVSAFDMKDRTSKAIILISDGGNLQGDPKAAAQEAKRKGIKIYAVGIGREDEEVPIPLEGGFKYSDGHMVTTKLDDKTLRDIALATGGIYVRSVTGDLDLERIYYEEINKKMEKTELESSRRKRWEERFQWPLFAAVALLFAEACIGERQRNAEA